MPEFFIGDRPPDIPRDGLMCQGCGMQKDTAKRYTYLIGVEVHFYCDDCIQAYRTCECPDCDGKFLSGMYQPKLIEMQYPGINKRCQACAGVIIDTTEPIPSAKCERCSIVYSGEDVSNQPYCPRCRESWQRCVACNENAARIPNKDNPAIYNLIVDAEGTLEQINYNGVCSVCIDEVVDTCLHCKEPYKKGEDESYCPICRTKTELCEMCGEKKMGVKEYHGHKACSICQEIRFSTCEVCDKIKPDCGAEYHHHHDNRHIRKCGDCIGAPILDYRFKKNPVFFGKGPLFFGVENEYDWRRGVDWEGYTDQLRQWTWDNRHLYYLVHDGSLDRGVEIVSMPCSFEYWMGLKEIMPELDNDLSMGTQGCHVHLSKDAFTGFHLFKFMQFLTQNFDNLVCIFGRGVGAYSRNVGSSLVKFTKEQYAPDHYWWINMNSGKTVEIRIFTGARTSQDIRENLQLLHAAYVYTMEHNPAEILDWRAFFRFVNSKEEYADLAEALDKKPKPQEYVVPKILPLSEEEEKEVESGEIAVDPKKSRRVGWVG